MTDHIVDINKKVLSPAAQAVLDAACDALDQRGYISDQVAAALRALADQVVPEGGNFIAVRIRAAILTIATELEGDEPPL